MNLRIQWIRWSIAWSLTLTIALGVVGQVVGDRSVILGLCLYLPLVLLGLIAVVFDAICRGRALPRGRFVLAIVGLAASIGTGWTMIGLGSLAKGGDGTEISLLHWNVYWGGGKPLQTAKWAAIRREIRDQGADLVVLSEAPPDEWLDELTVDLGPGSNRVEIENEPGENAWVKLVVYSRGPLKLIRHEKFVDGDGIIVEAEVRGQVVRLFVVDARSNPLLLRTPRLLDIAGVCHRARESGQPIDVIVGDFNTVSRSLGFAAIEAEGYALASRSATGWRGTFPSILPLYDIDHVWVSNDRPVVEAHLFTNLASDHRGQVARFRTPN